MGLRLFGAMFFLCASPILAVSPAFKFETMILADKNKTVIDYAEIVADKIDPDKLVLLLPPGAQTREAVEKGFRPWADGLKRAGYTVFSPIAPGGVLFYEGSEKYVPHFVKSLRKKHKLNAAQFNLVGLSNGGISAFRVAVTHPKLWRTLVVAPGFAKPVDEKRLDRLGGLPVTIFVGAKDGPWLKKANELVFGLRRLKQSGEVKVIGSSGHKVYERVPVEQVLQVLEK